MRFLKVNRNHKLLLFPGAVLNGRLGQFFNLIWLIVLVLKTAPVPSIIWGIASIVRSILLPINLWITKYLVDEIAVVIKVGVNSNRGFFWLSVLILGLLVQRFLGWIHPWLSGIFREVAGREVTRLVLVKSPKISLEHFEYSSYYDNLNRSTSGIESRATSIIDEVVSVVHAFSHVVGYGAILVAIHPLILLVVLVVILMSMVFFISRGQNVWTVLSRQTFERRLGDYYGSLLTNRKSIKETRLYGIEKYFSKRWSELFWKSRTELQHEAMRANMQQMSVFGVNILVSVGIIYWIIVNPSPDASPGLYAILFQAILGMNDPISQFLAGVHKLGRESGYASDLREFLSLPEIYQNSKNSGNTPDLATTRELRNRESLRQFPRPLRYGIQFEDVSYTYPGSTIPAVRNLTLKIRPGEKVAVVGRNGSGKTTFVRLLLGFYRPDSGRILFDGLDSREIDPRSLCKSISAVMQTFVHYNLTLAENVALSSVDTERQKLVVREAIRRVGAANIVEALPDGYNALIGPELGGKDLSGGEWQRVALARGFLRSAEVLVLDEPTSALDPLTELMIFKRYRDLVGERTALMISHRLAVARLVDRVIVFRDGTIIEDGEHHHLLEAKGEYATLFHAQARWYR